MRSVSELLDQQTRGEDISPNPDNKVTKKRKSWGHGIREAAGNNREAAYTESMGILENNIPRLQEFVLTHGEAPAPELPDLVQQVYQLRMADVKETTSILEFDNETSLVHLEDQENNFIEDNGYKLDSFLGELFAPVDIAYSYLSNQNADSFAAQDIVNGLIPMIGEKFNHATLIRAAQGKDKAGIIGSLSTGGKRHYESLVDYFIKYPDVAKKVLSGEITDEMQLPNWRTPTQSNLSDIAQPLINNQLKKALPYIIGFLVLIGVIVYVASRSKK